MTPRRLGLLLTFALVATSMGGLDAAAAERGRPPGNEAGPASTTTLLVTREVGMDSADVVDELGDARIRVKAADDLPRFSTTRIEVGTADTDIAVAELRRTDGVASVTLDQPVSAFAMVPNDPGFSSRWGVRNTNVDKVWPSTTGSGDVVLAIIDTGVSTVADLAGRVLPGRDFVNNDADDSDDHGHGTQVATVAAAAGNDGQGIAGACWSCKILPVKVLAANGTGYLANVASGIVWAVDHGADVINLSLGGPTNIPLVDAAVNYATSHNVVVLAAAGNDGTTNPNYPAGIVGTIAVGATDPANAPYSFSNRGSGWVDIAAPGCNTASGTSPPSSFCGTSSASPLAAGIVGLLRTAQPGLTAASIRASLEMSARPLAVGGIVSSGLVDAAGALDTVNRAANGSTPWVSTVDTTAPAGRVLDSGSLMSGTTETKVVTYDDMAVGSAQLYADGSLVGSASPGGNGIASISWPTGWHPDGAVTLRAVIVDTAGNAFTTADLVTRIDNQAPGLLLSDPRQGAKVGARFNVTVTANDTNDTLMTLVAVGGRIVGGSQGNGTFRFSVAPPRSGRLQVVAAAVDHAGHISFSNVVMVDAKVKAPAKARRR